MFVLTVETPWFMRKADAYVKVVAIQRAAELALTTDQMKYLLILDRSKHSECALVYAALR